MKSNKLPWQQLHESGGFEGRLAKEMGVMTAPLMILVGADGKVVNRDVQLTDLEDEWIQHYFDYLSKDTIAAKAELVITRKPIVLKCDECAHSFEIDKNDMKDIACPECGNQKCSLESGREYYIKNMEVV